jgi:hypothetical protein
MLRGIGQVVSLVNLCETEAAVMAKERHRRELWAIIQLALHPQNGVT